MRPDRVLLASRPQSQLPELPNGCEVTSLSMLLQAVGHPVDKLILAAQQPTDTSQPVFQSILRWGNPNEAFVGLTGGSYGYGIYHGPLAALLDRYFPGRALDLTGDPFAKVQQQLLSGIPVVVWTTTTMRPPTQWVTWQTDLGPFRATNSEHAVLLVGYSRAGLVIDNPLSGQQELVQTDPFLAAWKALGQQAITLRAEPHQS
jgi:uncharacterized protein YvpB